MASMVDKQDCLLAAVEITKEYARGSNGTVAYSYIPELLEATYIKLVSLMETSKQP